jgi:hypothetical protein
LFTAADAGADRRSQSCITRLTLGHADGAPSLARRRVTIFGGRMPSLHLPRNQPRGQSVVMKPGDPLVAWPWSERCSGPLPDLGQYTRDSSLSDAALVDRELEPIQGSKALVWLRVRGSVCSRSFKLADSPRPRQSGRTGKVSGHTVWLILAADGIENGFQQWCFFVFSLAWSPGRSFFVAMLPSFVRPSDEYIS